MAVTIRTFGNHSPGLEAQAIPSSYPVTNNSLLLLILAALKIA